MANRPIVNAASSCPAARPAQAAKCMTMQVSGQESHVLQPQPESPEAAVHETSIRRLQVILNLQPHSSAAFNNHLLTTLQHLVQPCLTKPYCTTSYLTSPAAS